jgi:hypothetical protein
VPADRPDRVEPLGLEQRPVRRDPPVEQRAHVGAERRRGDDLGDPQVVLGHEQEQQVPEVVALVRSDQQNLHKLDRVYRVNPDLRTS